MWEAFRFGLEDIFKNKIYSAEYDGIPFMQTLRGLKYVIEGDDVTAVLRGHANLDVILLRLILLKAPYAEAFGKTRNLIFSRRVDILKNLGVINPAAQHFFKEFNAIRNDIAHNVNQVVLTDKQDKRIEVAVPPEWMDDFKTYCTQIETDYSHLHGPSGHRTRAAIILLVLQMFKVEFELVKDDREYVTNLFTSQRQ